MGLIRDALEAIIRIDMNLAAIRKALTKGSVDSLYRAAYLQRPVEPRGSTYCRVQTGECFCYPDSLTFGGRLRAVRMFYNLTQKEIGDSIGVTCGYISNLEKDITSPSAMLIRAASLSWHIDEQWLATGKLRTGDQAEAQTAEEKIRRILPQHVGIDWGDPNGSFTVTEELSAEQDLCDSIAQSLRSAGEEAGSDRQGKAHCSRYPSRCTQGSSDKQTS